MTLPTNPPLEIAHLDPELQAVALARVAREMDEVRRALGYGGNAPAPSHTCGCPADAPVVTVGDVAFCPRCSP